MSRPETCPEHRPVCKACHCFVDDHVPLQSTLHKWWCHGCADHCDGFSHDAAPPPAARERDEARAGWTAALNGVPVRNADEVFARIDRCLEDKA